jgi:hypothetical protein
MRNSSRSSSRPAAHLLFDGTPDPSKVMGTGTEQLSRFPRLEYPPMITRLLPMLGLGLLLSLRLTATSVEPPALDSLISQSDYVVRAVVRSTTSEWKEHEGRRYIGTRVELELLEVIKGTPPSPLVLDLIGGRVGKDELVVTGMPIFHVGDESVLFVHGEQRKMFPLVAMMHGVYPVMRDAKSGQEYALRSNGMPLYSAQDVSLPLDRMSPVKQRDPSVRPLSSSTFVRQIRDRAASLTTTREN